MVAQVWGRHSENPGVFAKRVVVTGPGIGENEAGPVRRKEGRVGWAHSQF